MTLTPYVSSRTRTLEARYRQAFLNGSLRIEGALSQDDIRDGELRGYLFDGPACSNCRDDYQLSFDLAAASDPAYLLDYGYSDEDRLTSQVALERYRLRDMTRATLTRYESAAPGREPILAAAAGPVLHARGAARCTLGRHG